MVTADEEREAHEAEHEIDKELAKRKKIREEMEKLDQFATGAISGLILRAGNSLRGRKNIPLRAYEIAEVMMRQRAVKTNEKLNKVRLEPWPEEEI